MVHVNVHKRDDLLNNNKFLNRSNLLVSIDFLT